MKVQKQPSRGVLKKRCSENMQIANTEDGVSLIFILQNTMAAMGHDGPSLPFDFKFPFQNKSILIKSNLIIKTRATNEKQYQVKV